MSSFAPASPEIKSYVESVGPKLGRPPRPQSCVRPTCPSDWIWYDGWRLVYATVLVEGVPRRFDDGLWVQRVACSACFASWTLRPAFLSAGNSYAADVVEAACAAYLSEASATYAKTSARLGCSWTAVWGWVSWLGRLAEPAAVVAEAARVAPGGAGAELIPRAVPQDHAKGRSADRQAVLLKALQLLAALVVLGRAQTIPSTDPSPLRSYVLLSFPGSVDSAVRRFSKRSPATDVAHRGPPRR